MRTSSLPPDPGGIFDSDYHRRVLAHLPQDSPMTLEDLHARMLPDEETNLEDPSAVEPILEDLIADGVAEKHGDGYRMNTRGFEALTGPRAAEPAPMTGDRLQRAEEVNARMRDEDRNLEIEQTKHVLEEAEETVKELRKIAKEIAK